MQETWVSVPGSGRSPGVGNGTPLQYSCLGNSMDRGTWWTTVHRVAESWPQLSDWEGYGNPLQYSRLENPREKEPGRLPSMGLHRVRHNWSNLAAAAARNWAQNQNTYKICTRKRKWCHKIKKKKKNLHHMSKVPKARLSYRRPFRM